MRLVVTLCLSIIISPALAKPQIELIPAQSAGAYTIDGNEIVVPPGGVLVHVDAFVSGWAPDQIWIAQAGFTLDGGVFSGGTAGMLSFYRPPCTSYKQPEGQVECSVIFGVPQAQSLCAADLLCMSGYQDLQRADWLFLGREAIYAVGGDILSNWWAFGGAELNRLPISDDGSRKYLGSIIIEVSPDAAGTFRIDGLDEQCFVITLDSLLIYTTVVPAFITIGEAACGDGVLNQPEEECEVGPGHACSLGICQSDCTCVLAIPTVSEWGLVILTLMLLVGSKLAFGLRRPLRA